MIAIAIPSHYSHRPLLRSEEMSSHELIMHFDFVSKTISMQWKITSSRTDLIDVAIANQFLSRWTLKLYPRKFLGGLIYADPDSDALVA